MSYVELHCHSAYSFLDGASHPLELAGAAAEQGHAALALTDHDGLHGAMEMAQALKPLGVRPDHRRGDDAGGRLAPDAAVRDARGLHQPVPAAHRGPLAHAPLGARGLVDPRPGTDGRRPGQDPLTAAVRVSLDEVERNAAGLVCLSGCARHGAVARGVEAEDHRGGRRGGPRGCCGIFGPDRLRVELQRPFARHDRRRNRLLAELAERLGVPAVATGNVHAHAARAPALQDAMVAVRLGRTLDECEPQRRGNSSHALAPPEAMAERFAEHPEAVEESGRLAERLALRPHQDLGYRYPGSEDPDADRKLAELCRARSRSATPRAPQPRGGARPGSTRSCA